MPKEKFKKFKSLAANLLPHESEYLIQSIKSTDPDKLAILKNLASYVSQHSPKEPLVVDEKIDKRKYSNLLHWIQSELLKIDVDQKLQWTTSTHELILLDRVHPEREQHLINAAKQFTSSDFNFLRFYDMLIAYKHYLLIRMRYNEYQIIDQITQKYHYDYQRSKLIYEQLQQATVDIIGLGGSSLKREAIQWKNWLFQNFKNPQLDGLNRHMSAIRYIFVCLRYGAMDDLGHMLDLMDIFFKNGQNYSRRLLVNFYDNKLVYHDKSNNYKEAKFYGYLSIKYDQNDSIIYRNNLINLLIKNLQFTEALKVIESTDFKIKNTRNFHSAIGFISNHIRCLTKTNHVKEAVLKGRVFLNAYSSNIIKYRWHRFFSAYHGALLSQELYTEIIKNSEKYKLYEKELNQYSKREDKKLLTIFYYIALYKTNKLDRLNFQKKMKVILRKQDEPLYDSELLNIVNQIK
jgi:hypothetical protein